MWTTLQIGGSGNRIPKIFNGMRPIGPYLEDWLPRQAWRPSDPSPVPSATSHLRARDEVPDGAFFFFQRGLAKPSDFRRSAPGPKLVSERLASLFTRPSSPARRIKNWRIFSILVKPDCAVWAMSTDFKANRETQRRHGCARSRERIEPACGSVAFAALAGIGRAMGASGDDNGLCGTCASGSATRQGKACPATGLHLRIGGTEPDITL